MNKIGFACMILDNTGEVLDGTRMRTTTVKHFSTLSEPDKYKRIKELALNNVIALQNQVKWLVRQPAVAQFMRITSDLLPLYTFPGTDVYYKPIMNTISGVLANVGQLARQFNIRLTSHPDQFVVMNAPYVDTDAVDNQGNPLAYAGLIQRSVRELEYHALIFQMMSLDFSDGSVINIHGGGKSNPLDNIVDNSQLLSFRARRMLTIENDEFSYGIDELLNSQIPDNFPIVVDVHHHAINTGTYIEANDDRWQRVIQSWRGITPKIHISISPESMLENLLTDSMGRHIMPESKRSKLRAHSDMIWNSDYRHYALSFLKYGDLMIEAKSKNLASEQLIREIANVQK